MESRKRKRREERRTRRGRVRFVMGMFLRFLWGEVVVGRGRGA